jgi:hypothetical protein
MNGAQYSRITNFIWGIADDVLRDLYAGPWQSCVLHQMPESACRSLAPGLDQRGRVGTGP